MQRHIAAAEASSAVIAGMIYRMRRHIAAACHPLNSITPLLATSRRYHLSHSLSTLAHVFFSGASVSLPARLCDQIKCFLYVVFTICG